MNNQLNTYKIDTVRAITGCSEQTAIAYLVAEEWGINDALLSYRADQQGNT